MVCPGCGTDNRSDRKFCLRCGRPLAATCPQCGSPNEAEAGFCGECGAPLETTAAGPAERPPALPVAPAPVAERRLVSVLFADLVGFTSFAEERDSEDVREALSRYFELASEVIGRYGGTVEKFIGDAVMAVWGTPTAREDDAERAVRAGLELVAAIPTLDPAIQARAGVLTGEAAVNLGAVGEGMVAGDLVNTASRLQSVAPIGGVLVGEATMHAASRAISFVDAGPQALKGKAEPVPAWRAVRVVAEVGGRGRSEALEAPFVGRAEELRLLKELFHATARDRRPRLVSVTGIGGIGKSRLAWELSKYVGGLAEPVFWHAGRSPAYGDGVSFWALGEMVRSRAGLLEADGEPKVRERVAEVVRRWVPDESERGWIEPALLALLGSGEVPRERREELFAAWRTFFERIAADHIVVMVFEDLQWADPGLLDFIDHLLDWSRGVPLYVVTLARPELLDRRPGWGAGKREFSSVSLGPLADDAVHELVAGLVPDLPPSTVTAIVERSDGVPLYAVEFIRMLLAEGRLVRRDGSLAPAGSLAALGVPETLHELIGARLDALDPVDRAVLADAAVLGQSFTVEALEAVGGRPRHELDTSLRSLVRREFLSRESNARSPERGQLAFMQSLVREVAYSRLSRRDRRTRHLASARWFEGLGTDELAGALAGQYLAAYQCSADGAEADEVADEARVAIGAAAERATALGSHAQAVAFLEQALSVTTVPSDQALLLERLGRSASLAGDHDAAARHLGRAIELHRATDELPGAARTITQLGAALIEGFQSETALKLLEAAAAEFAGLADDPAVIGLDGQLARALFLGDDWARAIAVADRTLAAAERQDLVEIVADTLITRGSALCNGGRMYEGTGAVRTGIALAKANGLIATTWRGLVNLSASLLDSDVRGMLEVAREALALAVRRGDRGRVAFTLQNATAAAIETGDWDWARTEIEAARETTPGDLERAELMLARLTIDSLRGQDVAEEASWLEAVLTASDEPRVRESVIVLRYQLAVGEGRLHDASEAALEHARIHPDEGSMAYADAALLALWTRDRNGAAAALAGLDATGAHGKVVDMNRRTIRGGLAGLEGRSRDALSAFREALTGWRELGAPWRLALTAITMATVLDTAEPEVRAATDEARVILDRLGAWPFLRLLETDSVPQPAVEAIAVPTLKGA